MIYRCCYAVRWCCCRRREPALAAAVDKFARTLSGGNAAHAAINAANNNHPGIQRRDARLTSSARRACHGSARSGSRPGDDRYRSPRRHSLSDVTSVTASVDPRDVKAACVIDLNALTLQRQTTTTMMPLIGNELLVAESASCGARGLTADVAELTTSS